MVLQHVDILREAARRLGRHALAERLTDWSQQRPQGPFRVAFVGGPAKTRLIRRLLDLPDTGDGGLPVPVRYEHGVTDAVLVQLADGTTIDTSLAALPVAIAGRGAIVALATSPAMPSGVQWCDTPAPQTAGRDADTAHLTLRYCDAAVLAIAADADPAGDPVEPTELAVLRAGHVPLMIVIVTDAAEPARGPAAHLLARITDAVRDADVTVHIEPVPGTARHAAWRTTFLAAQPPRDLDASRRRQAAAQLRAIGECLVTAAEDSAVDEHRHIGTDSARLAQVQTRADWLLDAAAVRRELHTRRQRALAGATGTLQRLAVALVDRAERLLAVSAGGNDTTQIMMDLRDRADTALIRVREQYGHAVAGDVAWLDARLRDYVEAWSQARPAPEHPAPEHPAPHAGTGSILDRYMPRMHPAWAARAACTPLDVLADVAVETVRALPGGPDRGRPGAPGSPAARRFVVEALTAGRSPALTRSTVPVGAQVPAHPTGSPAVPGSSDAGGSGGLSGRGGRTDGATMPAAVGAAPRGCALGTATTQVYSGLADEFDAQRRRWRRTQLDGVDRIRRSAYQEWRALAAQLRAVLRTLPTEDPDTHPDIKETGPSERAETPTSMKTGSENGLGNAVT